MVDGVEKTGPVFAAVDLRPSGRKMFVERGRREPGFVLFDSVNAGFDGIVLEVGEKGGEGGVVFGVCF